MSKLHLATLLMLATLPMAAEPDAFEAERFDGPRFVDKQTCRIFAHGVGRERCFAPDDGGGGAGAGGGGGSGDEKKFTQADIDRIVTDRLKKASGELTALQAKVQEQATALGELGEIKKKLEDADKRETAAREEAELKGKTELERLQIAITKLTDAGKQKDAALQAKDQEWQQKHGALSTAFDDHVKTQLAAAALLGAKVHGAAAADAAMMFMRSAAIDLDEKRGIKSVSIDGTPFSDLKSAAAEWLKTKPWYAEAQPGGSGTPPGAGRSGQPLSAKDLASRTPEELLNEGLSSPVKPVAGGLSLVG